MGSAQGAAEDGSVGSLAELSRALADTRTVDDVARATLDAAMALPGTVRAGIAVSEGAGRRLFFGASTSRPSGPVDWCRIDGEADVPLAQTVRSGRAVYLPSPDDLAQRYPHMVAHQQEFGVRRLASVPLVADGVHLGGVLLTYGDPGDFSAMEISQLAGLGAQVSSALYEVGAVGRPADGPEARRRSTEPAPASPVDPSGPRYASVELPAHPRAAAMSRRFLDEQLSGWGIDDEVRSLVCLCASEIVTNAVLHSGTAPTVDVGVNDEAVAVSVRDEGRQGVVRQVKGLQPLDVAGRGLALVAALADEWDADHRPDGTIVWFTVSLARETASHA